MKICITGGAGYVGSALSPILLQKGHEVTVLDTFWFGDHLAAHPNLRKLVGDIRSRATLRTAFSGQDAVIHLACVSNDPSFDMNPDLGRSINFACFKDMLTILQEKNVGRFIYASSSSVYGVSDLKQVTEDTQKNPLTYYSKYKLACEIELQTYGMGGVWTILRPATVCGYAPRMRLDLVVNILTIQALVNRHIRIFGGDQTRPNINILDMVGAYDFILNADERAIDQQIFNVGFENLSLIEIGTTVRALIDQQAVMSFEKTLDTRSYRVNSDKIMEAGFAPAHEIATAIQSIQFNLPNLKDPMNNPIYSNIKQMKELGL
jgi:nucleoside-diphosphate-sugar epimerase